MMKFVVRGKGVLSSIIFFTLQETEPHYYTAQLIKGLIRVILLAETDTSAVTLEWAMSNVLNNPNVLKKARAEIDSKIEQDKLIEEQDVSKLPHLKSIIFQTFRLNPAGPLLLPHMASSDCTTSGHDVSLETIVLVNAWAIHMARELWDEPKSFRRERFGEGEGELNKLVTFGLGRRACPGAGLAQRIMGLTLGSLIQCFEWERVGDKDIDMAEGVGLAMNKVVPQEAIVNKVIGGTALQYGIYVSN